MQRLSLDPYSTGAEIATMQLAKVVVTSVLVLAVCAEGLPEGKSSMNTRGEIYQIAYLGCYTEVICSKTFILCVMINPLI